MMHQKPMKCLCKVQKPSDRTEPTQLKTISSIMIETNPKERIKPLDLYCSNISICFQWTVTTSEPRVVVVYFLILSEQESAVLLESQQSHEKSHDAVPEGEKPLQLQKN